MGYMYAVQHPVTNLIKIGKTSNIDQRLTALRYEGGKAHTPALIILKVIEIPYESICEQAMHWYFRDKRRHGEWFALHPMDIHEIFLLEKIQDIVSQSPYAFPTNPSIGNTIRQIRKEKGLFQDWVAARAGISTHTLNRLEQDKHPPQLATVWRVAHAMEMPCWELVQRAENA